MAGGVQGEAEQKEEDLSRWDTEMLPAGRNWDRRKTICVCLLFISSEEMA